MPRNFLQTLGSGLDPGGYGRNIAAQEALDLNERKFSADQDNAQRDRVDAIKAKVLEFQAKNYGQLSAADRERLNPQLGLSESLSAAPKEEPKHKLIAYLSALESIKNEQPPPGLDAAGVKAFNDKKTAAAATYQAAIDKETNVDESLKAVDLGDRVVYMNKKGEIVRTQNKGAAPTAAAAPSTTLVNIKDAEGKVHTFRASDPRIDDILLAGGVKVGTGGKGFNASVTSPDGTTMQLRSGDSDTTIGTQGNLEREIGNLDVGIMNVMKLATVLRPKDVGLPGVLGEMLYDNIAGQLDASFIDPTRVRNRGLLRSVRESSLRMVSTDSKFNQADRDAIELIFPKDGIFESQPAAREKLLMLAELFRDRALIKGGMINRKPITAMSPAEIRAALEAGMIDKVTAIRAITLLH